MIKRTIYFGNPAYLRVKDEQLVVFFPETEEEKTAAIEDIGVVLLDHPRITLTQTVLTKLLANKAIVINCDEKHMPSGLMLPMEGHSVQTEVQRYQLAASVPLIKRLWQQTIEAKIRNQRLVLEYLDKDGRRLAVLEKRVLSGDEKNAEGQAAAWYWKNLFDDFTRGRYGDWPNELLNYGYAVLRAIIARALVSSGLLPQIGIFHSNKYNAFGLADDIMEPFRPFVDLIVYEIFHHYQGEEKLTKTIKAQLLSIATKDGQFGKLQRPLFIGASITSASLVACFTGEKRKIIYPSIPC